METEERGFRQEKRKTARVRTQGPLKEEATRQRDGEFRGKHGRKKGVGRGRRRKGRGRGRRTEKNRWWKNCKESIVSLSRTEDEKEKESRKRARRPKARQTLEKLGKSLFLLLPLERNWLSVSGCSGRTTKRYGSDGENATRSADQRNAV